jgi:hypothetical protein
MRADIHTVFYMLLNISIIQAPAFIVFHAGNNPCKEDPGMNYPHQTLHTPNIIMYNGNIFINSEDRPYSLFASQTLLFNTAELKIGRIISSLIAFFSFLSFSALIIPIPALKFKIGTR